ncbi:hypothetical protein ACFO0S_07930 [Chryseomicrobium palamuruense]|uniref:Uncharacterized protein n=1 Tax=Chryseomicrobium palamuruense TaxID=682973 RepID=A0ABV8UVX9_9BACL
MYSLMEDFFGMVKNVVAMGLYFVVGFLGVVGIVYLLTHLFSMVAAASVLDDQFRIVWQTIRYRM